MKKSLQFFFTVCFAVLLLASCGEEELSVDDSKEVSETGTSASKAVENGDLDLMLIQDESVIFPQSQGVYDFHENELTIVKQYLPMADLEDSSASASDVALYEGQIESDFQRHFSHSEVQLSNDPYQIYGSDAPFRSYCWKKSTAKSRSKRLRNEPISTGEHFINIIRIRPLCWRRSKGSLLSRSHRTCSRKICHWIFGWKSC